MSAALKSLGVLVNFRSPNEQSMFHGETHNAEIVSTRIMLFVIENECSEIFYHREECRREMRKSAQHQLKSRASKILSNYFLLYILSNRVKRASFQPSQ